MEGSDELDQMIDRALACYSGGEPLAGLEERVLHRVRAGEATSRRPLRWAFAFAAAAALVLLAIVLRMPRNPAPKTGDNARVEVPAPVRSMTAVEKPRFASKLRRGRIAARRALAPLPKEERFPVPAPLTPEEQALRSFVERHPAEAQQVFAQLQKRSNEPIQIEPIQIAPLQIDGAQ